jgi:hypothetical protein
MRFSSRLRAKTNQALTYEDAPRPTRIGYLKGVLNAFVGSHQGYGQKTLPLDAYATHTAFIALIRDEHDAHDYDSQDSWAALSEHLKQCSWPEFYDFVELAGKLLLAKDDEIPFGEAEYFEAYQKKVNELLEEDGIGWTLSEKSELRRQVPSAMAKRLQAAQSALTDRYSTARVHYQKAERYLYQHPVDEANSIKEMVSAVESVAKGIASKASTLGEAIKLLRNDPRFSTHLLDALEKIYVYSNATPLVRHGHVSEGKPLLREAELVFFSGVAYILYLIEADATPTPTQVKRIAPPSRY